MRLIDVDAITTETFKSYVGENGGFISFGDAVDAIEAIPTAYDMDAVISELDDYLFDKYCVENDSEIIDIVKRGGIDED